MVILVWLEKLKLRRSRSTLGVALTAALLAGGCQGSGPARGPNPLRPNPLGRSFATAPATNAPAPAARPANSPATTTPPRPEKPAGKAWAVDPDQPLRAHSPWAGVLAVARRFAVANTQYEAGHLPHAVRRAIEATCTPRLARELLAQPPALPPGIPITRVDERVRSLTPLGELAHRADVLVSVTRKLRRTSTPGSLELTLARQRGRWLVDHLSVLS